MLPRRLLPFLARFVLAWFALHVGAGVAAPLLRTDAGLQLVCTGGTLKVLPDSGDAGAKRLAGMDCPLCSPMIAPPPVAVATAVVHGGGAAVAVLRATPPPRLALAPPSARGPPPGIRT